MTNYARPKVGTAAWWQKWTRYEPETQCVFYTGYTRPDGYAQVYWNRGRILVHRLAYEQANGPITSGLVVCHDCDTPRCVNPKHLVVGTQKDNLRDMFAKGRARPRGKATAPMTAFPSVSYRAPVREYKALTVPRKKPLLEVTSLNSAQVLDILHHIRRPAQSNPEPDATPVWCQVRNVPQTRPTRAIVLWQRPLSWTDCLGSSDKAVALLHARPAGGAPVVSAPRART